MLDNLLYSNTVDMWSIGVIIYEMLTGYRMFIANSEIEYLLEVMQRKGTPDGLNLS